MIIRTIKGMQMILLLSFIKYKTVFCNSVLKDVGDMPVFLLMKPDVKS